MDQGTLSESQVNAFPIGLRDRWHETVFVFPYTDKGLLRPKANETVEVLKLLRSNGARVVTYQCTEEKSYEEMFRKVWDAPIDYVIIEHDMVPTVDQITDIVLCPFPTCTFDYQLNDWGALACRDVDVEPLEAYGHKAHVFCKLAGLGFTKLGWQQRARISLRDLEESNYEWRDLDSRLSRLINKHNGTFHVHDGLVHHNYAK